MPKKVKTKKQKMRSDLRHTNYSPEIEKADFTTYSLPALKRADHKPTPAEQTFSAPIKAVSTTGYSYLSTDLRKTILLTVSIIVVQILVKYYLKI